MISKCDDNEAEGSELKILLFKVFGKAKSSKFRNCKAFYMMKQFGHSTFFIFVFFLSFCVGRKVPTAYFKNI